MTPKLLLAALVLAVTARAAVQIDDSYQSVLEQCGAPSGKAQAGDMMILRYPDQTIRLKAGKVVAVEAMKPSAGAARPPAHVAPAPAAKPPPPAPADATSVDAVPATPLTWTTDYQAALASAKEQNRRVFLFFTGSDWCGWCMRLNREILSTPQFANYANDNLILVEVDFPHGKAQSPAIKRRNALLARAFEITGFPTVVILNENGRAIGRLGYQEGGPIPFIGAMKRL